MTYIYALVDPRDNRFRYIGKADDPKLRFSRHLQPKRLQVESHKNTWLRSILTENIRPELVLLECVPKTRWQDAEKYWIAYFVAYGEDLTNGTPGGDGVALYGPDNAMYGVTGAAHPSFGKKRPKEVVDRIRAAQKGRSRSFSPTALAKMQAIGKTLVGSNNHFFGREHSHATKQRWSELRAKMYITANGKTQSVAAWSRETGVKTDALRARINSGWTPERAVNTPRLRARGPASENGAK